MGDWAVHALIDCLLGGLAVGLVAALVRPSRH